MAQIAGRQVEIGIGIETSPGTPVSANDYFKWDTFSFQGMSDKVMLNSARGIRNKSSNSLIIKKYGKGTLEFSPTVDILPYVLGLLFGTRSSGAASGETTGAYDHTFTVQNNNAAMKTATILVKQGGVQTERYANCVVDSLSLTIEKDLVKAKIEFLGQFPDTGSISSSYTKDTLFSRNEMNAYFGDSLSAATGTRAAATVTTDTTNAANNSTVTIGSVVYTFVTNLSGAAYEVKIGADAATTLDNLKAAINAASGAGTTYGTGTLAHPYVVATTNTNTTQLIQAKTQGTAANSLATLASGSPNSHLSWVGSTISADTPGTVDATPLVALTLDINNNVLFDQAFLSGSAGVAAGGFVAGPLEIKGTYTLQFKDTTELAKYQQNTQKAMIIQSLGGLIGVNPNLEQITFKLGRLVLTKQPLTYQLEDLVLLKQEFTVEYDATDHEASAVVTNTYAGTNYQ